MKKTAFTASTPVLHLPVKSLLQTALLFFLSFLLILLGQFFALPEACNWGNTTTSTTTPQMNREGLFLLSLAHLRWRMIEKREGKGKRKPDHSREGRSEQSHHWAIGPSAPQLSSGKGVSSQLKRGRTLTLSPPEAGLIHCSRHLITQEDCFL